MAAICKLSSSLPSLTFSTHDSMNARKAHNTGRNHVSNVRDYFAGLGHDKAQNIIDAIIQSHEGGGRAQMMAAPSMRLGAGFMNPVGPSGLSITTTLMADFAPFPATAPPFPPNAPPFAPPFPPNNAMPPFPPAGGMPPFAPRPPPQQQQPSFGPPPSFVPQNAPPSGFTPLNQPPPGAPGIHPDRLRMLGP